MCSAFQALLSKKDVGPASAVANRQISTTNVPLREIASDFGAYASFFGGWKARRLSVRSIDHRATADHDLIEARERMWELMKPLLQQQGNRLDPGNLVTEKLEELHLFEHRADIEPRKARVCRRLLVFVERLLQVAGNKVELTEGSAGPDGFVFVLEFRRRGETDDGLEIFKVEDFWLGDSLVSAHRSKQCATCLYRRDQGDREPRGH
jgi:hypothetical protein